MSKSNVSLDTCMYCGEAKGILLDKRLKDSLEPKTVTSYEPCDACKADMAKGFTLFEANQDGSHTGRMWVVKPEIVDPDFRKQCPNNIARILHEDAIAMGLLEE